MQRFGRFAAFTAAALTIAGLSAGSAAAHPAAGASGPHAAIHGTGGLRPDIHLPSDGRATVNPAGLPIQYSGNWSGYLTLPKTGKASAFRYVQASYTVPSVNCGVTPTAFVYNWVGLDGDTDGTVEQDGVGSYCIGGSPEYFAWYEMFPQGLQLQFYLNAGDAVNSSVYYNSSTKEYSLTLTDLTSGQTFSTNQACPTGYTCNNSTAEVITEGYPSGSYGGVADFGLEQFDNIWVTSTAGHHGLLTDSTWNTDESIAEGASGIDTEPNAIYAASVPASPLLSAYSDQWYHEN
jgi:Peptidase A4 family